MPFVGLRWPAAALAAALAVACGDAATESPGPDASVASAPDGGAAGSADAAGANPDGGGLGFMDACDPADDRCAADLVCFQFNSRGPHCTHECMRDEDCEAPSRGCNNMGLCKAP